MAIWEIVVLAAAVSMDAFAVAVCKGVALPRYRLRQSVTAGLWFGGFQALMPTLGFFLGALFGLLLDSFDHWIAMLILVAIGYNTLRGSFAEEEPEEGEDAGEDTAEDEMRPAAMFPLAVATSIDAFAVGITLAFRRVDIVFPAALIGTTTFAMAGAGVWIGRRFGERFGKTAERAGGIILILLGVKVLADHIWG
ncbi:MAG: manganese efflux pump MntP family protein [Oscillospiraceae bacterium]|jgi:putative Mn2+ efflux pump MntP|nr:manganese efflux pump MntP family protein [Oscillospiraceae bacterium]